MKNQKFTIFTTLEWIKFDYDDHSTWPKQSSNFIALIDDCFYRAMRNYGDVEMEYFNQNKITWWAYLPRIDTTWKLEHE